MTRRKFLSKLVAYEWKNRARPENEQRAKDLLRKDLLSTTLAFGHENRKPIQINIDGQIIVLPSINIVKTFKLAAGVGGGLLVEPASIAEYRLSSVKCYRH